MHKGPNRGKGLNPEKKTIYILSSDPFDQDMAMQAKAHLGWVENVRRGSVAVADFV